MKNIVLIMGSFHKKEITLMRNKAVEVAKELNLNVVSEIWVPGSLEKPLALKREFRKENVDGAVLLGIIEKGETKHGRVMGGAVTNSVLDVQLEFMKPVGMGILGPGIEAEQIAPRLVPYAEAAVRAVNEMLI